MTANLILYNGDIHTMDRARPRARALAVSGNRVLAVGDDTEILPLRSPGGRAIDLRGRTVVPGFTDAHLHFMAYGLTLGQVALMGVPSLEETLARVAAVASTTPPGYWLQGRGWDNTLWAYDAFPARADLDRVTAEHPVLLKRKCGHIAWANSRALALAGIGAHTPDPDGGAIERDPVTGEPTGILKERAIDLVFDLIQEPSLDEAVFAIKAAMKQAHRLGLVGAHTMEGAVALRAFAKLRAEGELKLRVLMQIPEAELDAAVQLGLCSGFGDERLRIGGVKLFADGSLGGRTAHMLEPYDDAPDTCGIPVSSAAHLREVIGRASSAGIAAFVHAIGDRAVRDVLDAVEASRQAGQGLRLRHRIEHAQVIHPADMPRLARLGVVASMQPIHCTQDMFMAGPRWGSRNAGAYAWRSLLDNGTALAFGSDCPVEDLNVMKGIHAAVTRRRADGSPAEAGWYPDQRLTVDEAVYAYTAGAAYAGGTEDVQGTLAPGKLADLAVLSQDIFSIDPMAILETEVVATLFDGEFVHMSDAVL